MNRESQRVLARTIRGIYQQAAGVDYASQGTHLDMASNQRLMMLGQLYAEYGFVMPEAESYRVKKLSEIVSWYIERHEKMRAFIEYRHTISKAVSDQTGQARFISSLNGDARAIDLSLSPNEIINLCGLLAKRYSIRPEHLNRPDVKTVGDLCEAIHTYRDTLGCMVDNPVTPQDAMALVRVMAKFQLSIEQIRHERRELCVFAPTTNSARAWIAFNDTDDGSYERALLESTRAWLRLNGKEQSL